jgi:hypothetical protein
MAWRPCEDHVMALYDSLGRTYSATRRADPRIAAQISHALARCDSVVNWT